MRRPILMLMWIITVTVLSSCAGVRPKDPLPLDPGTVSTADHSVLGTQRIAFAMKRDGKTRIYMICGDETSVTKLSDGPADYDPMLSADGCALVYATGPQRTINFLNVHSERTRAVDEVAAGHGLRHPILSKHGNVLVYVLDSKQVLSMNPRQGTRTVVSRGFAAAGYYGIALSGDGSKVAFSSGHRPRDDGPSLHPTGELYVSHPNGSNLVRISRNGPKIKDICPSLSRDGTRMAYMSGNYPDWEIFTANTDGTNIRNVSRSKACDTAPAISPDGTKVAFVSDRGGDREIYLVDFEGGEIRQLTNSEIQCTRPNFSADGSVIFFETCTGSRRTDVCAMAVDGSWMRVLVRDMFDNRKNKKKPKRGEQPDQSDTGDRAPQQ